MELGMVGLGKISWQMIDSILRGWEAGNSPPLVIHPRGSWGPAEANEILARDGRAWLRGCGEH